MRKYKGSCKCEAVQFQLVGDIKKVVNCHCNQCRKMNSTAVSTYGIALESDLELTSGVLEKFTLKENAVKNFCGNCGTAIYNKNPRFPGLAMVYLYTLNDDNLPEPQVNVFCKSKLTWLDSVFDIPNFEQHAG